MKTLRLPQTLVNNILAQAQQSPEAEVCGLIAGRNDQASNHYPIHNQATQPGIRYAMDPQQQISALRQIREANEELIAIYHSHPHTPAQPSATDIAEANYPDAAYLIISLNTKGVLELSAFNIKASTVSNLDLELV